MSARVRELILLAVSVALSACATGPSVPRARPAPRDAVTAAAIERVLGDPAQAQRLCDAGRTQAARFTWAATARATGDSYDRAMARRGSA